jgi:hypothetical protein
MSQSQLRLCRSFRCQLVKDVPECLKRKKLCRPVIYLIAKYQQQREKKLHFFFGASRDSSIGGEFKFGDETKCANAIFSLFNLCYLRTNLCVKSRPQVAK